MPTLGQPGRLDFADIKNPHHIESFKKSLKVLKDYNSRLLTVFRPHPTTDMKILDEILHCINYRNYVISYLHPLLLMKRANFVICPGISSTLLTDSYYRAVPSIEFSNYHKDILKRTNGKGSYDKITDYFVNDDEAKLREVIDKILADGFKLDRDEEKMKELYPELSADEIKAKFHFLKE